MARRALRPHRTPLDALAQDRMDPLQELPARKKEEDPAGHARHDVLAVPRDGGRVRRFVRRDGRYAVHAPQRRLRRVIEGGLDARAPPLRGRPTRALKPWSSSPLAKVAEVRIVSTPRENSPSASRRPTSSGAARSSGPVRGHDTHRAVVGDGFRISARSRPNWTARAWSERTSASQARPSWRATAEAIVRSRAPSSGGAASGVLSRRRPEVSSSAPFSSCERASSTSSAAPRRFGRVRRRGERSSSSRQLAHHADLVAQGHDAAQRHLAAEARDRGLFEVVRLVENDRVERGEASAGQKERVVDHHDRGLVRPLAVLAPQAALPRRSGLTVADVRVAREPVPQVLRHRDRQVRPVARLRVARPRVERHDRLLRLVRDQRRLGAEAGQALDA